MNRDKLDAILRLVETDEKMRKGEIALPEPTPLEKLLEAVKKDGRVKRDGRLDGRVEAGKVRAKKNKSRKLRNARQARWNRGWKRRALERAAAGDWYPYLRRRWKDKQRGWDITEEEWNSWVAFRIPDGCVIEVRRKNTKLPTTIDNIVVYDSSCADVLFDGGWIGLTR